MTILNDKLWVSEHPPGTSIRPSNRGRLWTPRDLVEGHGFDLARFGEHDVFYDEVLGYRINWRSDTPQDGQQNFSLQIQNEYVAFQLGLPAMRGAAANDKSGSTLHMLNHVAAAAPWYAREMPGWNTYTGSGETVAVLDSGIAPALSQLPRDATHGDFLDCEGASLVAYDADANGHGTNCAGVVGAVWPTHQRYSAAPGCKILAAKITHSNGGSGTTLVDLVLMLSWAIQKGARVISMSFCSSRERLETKGPPDILGTIAQRLRNTDRALIFCAVMDQADSLSYPANLDGIIAVGVYADNGTVPPTISVGYVNTPLVWQHKHSAGELLFAPGSLLETVDLAGKRYSTFGGSSGACAFAAGLAALYLEKDGNLKTTFNDILAQMRTDASRQPNPADPANDWYCVRFP